jgi:hypothetical protein
MGRLLLTGLLVVSLIGCSKKPKKEPSPPPSKSKPVIPGPVGGAVRRVVAMNDMSQLHLFIENASLATGRMPTQQQILAELQRPAPNLYALLNDKSVILTGVRAREGIWAYTQEPQHGGDHIVISSSGVQRMSPQALRQRLQQQGR